MNSPGIPQSNPVCGLHIPNEVQICRTLTTGLGQGCAGPTPYGLGYMKLERGKVVQAKEFLFRPSEMNFTYPTPYEYW